MANSDLNPHIAEPHSPLSTLAHQALRRFGDFHPGTIDGDVMLMFVEFANMVIDEIRMHPYWDGSELNYYTHPSDIRPIPDPVIIAGLLFHYAMQQSSDKVQIYMPTYNKTLNHQLWTLKNGNTKIRMRVVDGGTNKRNTNHGVTDANNGTTSY